MKNKIIRIVLNILYLLVGIVSVVVSIYYSRKWFVYNGIPKVIRELLAIIYVLFLNILFENSISQWLYANKCKIESNKLVNKNYKGRLILLGIKKRLVASVIMFVWLLLASYSIISTIGGQYDQLSEIEEQLPQDTSNYKDEIAIIEEKIILYEERIYSNKKEVKILLKRLESIEDVEKSYKYKNTSKKNENRLDNLKENIETDEQQILSLKDQIISIKLKGSKVNSGSVFNYFEKIIKVKGYIIQFVLAFFPSIVVDFFAPISFALFLFGKKEKKYSK